MNIDAKAIQAAADTIRRKTAAGYSPKTGEALQELRDALPALHDAITESLAQRKSCEAAYYKRLADEAESKAADRRRMGLISLQTTEKGRQREVLLQVAEREVKIDPALLDRLRAEIGPRATWREIVLQHYPTVRDRWLVDNRHKWGAHELFLMLGERVDLTGKAQELDARIRAEDERAQKEANKPRFGRKARRPNPLGDD